MTLFTNAEYADIVFVYGFCNGNGRAAVEEYRRRYPDRRTPNHQTFAATFNSLREKGKFPDNNIERDRANDVVQEENILNLVRENPTTSTRRISAQLAISQTRVWKTINKENLYPFHMQEVQRLEEGDRLPRLAFARWILNHRRNLFRMLFTDEAQFTRDGIFNSRNSHVWANENPHAIRLAGSQRKFSVNVWCGLINDRLIGPHIFPERLTAIVYLNFLQNILPGLLDGVNLRGMYFQHDGAPAHFGIDVRNYLNRQFGERWIGRGGPLSWPARSPDYNPADYFLWGHLKQKVYSAPIETRDQLIQRINFYCDEIKENPQMVRRSIANLQKRAQKCLETGGMHFENVL
jgi:hypothetical protein